MSVTDLIKTSGTKESRVNVIGSVRCTDDENILFGIHTIHLCQNWGGCQMQTWNNEEA